VTVAFEDESAKLSLPRADAVTLAKLFEAWEVPQADAERLADALMGWMKSDHIYSTSVSPDYERSAIPFLAPARPLRSFHELAVIEVARELLFEEDGQPNALWHRFTRSVSLFDYRQPNINGANPDVLTAVGQLDETQQENLNEYLKGEGQFTTQGPGWFTDTAAARGIAGEAGNLEGFRTTISALRVLITVQEGLTQFRLSAVVAPIQNGARTVQTNATAARNPSSAAGTPGGGTQAQPSANPVASANPNAAANAKKLNYPFTLLEIQENDEIPLSPPPPPEPI
jgi:general secretion pathway protein K